MDPGRLGGWMRRYGALGVFAAGLYAGLRILHDRRRLVPLLAIVATLLPLTLWFVLTTSHHHRTQAPGRAPAVKALKQPTASPLSDVERFAALTRIWGKYGPDADRAGDELLDILIQATLKLCWQQHNITDEEIKRRLHDYERVLDDELDEFTIDTARYGNLRAIAVSYDSIARLAVYDVVSGSRLHLPDSVSALYHCYSPCPRYSVDGSLVVFINHHLISSNTGTEVDCLRRIQDGYRLEQTFDRTWIDYQLRGSDLTLCSLDYPESFLPCCMKDQTFTRKEVFRVSAGRMRRIALRKQAPVFRAVDAWITAALRSRHPNALQQSVWRYFSDPPLIQTAPDEDAHLVHGAVDVQFSTVSMRFHMRRTNAGYVVSRASITGP